MKVLKNGKNGDLNNWKIEVTCRKRDKYDRDDACGAVMEVTEGDLTLMYWEGTHFTHHYAAVRCPECGHYCAVNNVPEPIWERLNTAANRKIAVFDGFSESIW